MKQKSKKPRTQTTTRVTGDALLYFGLHNLISVFFFFLFTISVQVYDAEEITISFLLTFEFWRLILFEVFFCSLVSGVIGRVGAYSTIMLYFYFRNRKRTKQKITKRWGELNSGINQFNIIVFVLTAFLTSLIFGIGIIVVLQDRIFDSDSLWSLVALYILFKVGVYFGVRWFTKSKT